MTIWRTARLIKATALVAVAVSLIGCTKDDGRPKPRPDELTVRVASAAEKGKKPVLSRARISTKSGEILILEPDGEVSGMSLDSSEGQEAFAISEAELMALNSNLGLNLGVSDIVAGNLPPRQTAQEKMIEEFAARTRPALPKWVEGTEVDPAAFLGVRITVLNEGEGGDLVSVNANLSEGVDADLAFTYATCALAEWARANNTKYGRHVRTLQDTRNGKLLIDAAFTVSETKPLGLRVMKTDDALRECEKRGIPAA